MLIWCICYCFWKNHQGGVEGPETDTTQSLRDQVRKTGEGARSCLNVLANSSCFLFANFSCILFLYFSVINKCIRVNTPQFTEEEVVAQLNTILDSRVLFGVPVFIPIICWYFSCGGSESLGLLSFVGSLALHPISELRFGLWVNISPNMENKLKLWTNIEPIALHNWFCYLI